MKCSLIEKIITKQPITIQVPTHSPPNITFFWKLSGIKEPAREFYKKD